MMALVPITKQKSLSAVYARIRTLMGLGDSDWWLGPEGHKVQFSGTSIQFTITSDTYSSNQNHRRKKTTGDGDVTVGSTVRKWEAAGWRDDAFRFGWRDLTLVTELPAGYPDVVRMGRRISVTKEDGDDWVAHNYTHDGWYGIGYNGTMCVPVTEFDVLGEAAGAAIGFRSRPSVTSITDNVLPITKATGSLINLNVTGGATITDITEDFTAYPLLVLINGNASSVVIQHNSTKIRLAGKADVTLRTQQSMILVKTADDVWQEIRVKEPAQGVTGSTIIVRTGEPIMPPTMLPTTATVTPTTGRIWLFPVLASNIDLTKIAVEVTTADAAGNVRLGVYAHDVNTGLPTGTPLFDSGSLSAAATGVLEATISPAINSETWVWIAVAYEGALSFRSTLQGAQVLGILDLSSGCKGYFRTFAYGAFPDITGLSLSKTSTAMACYVKA